jgi:hypothetical protein
VYIERLFPLTLIRFGEQVYLFYDTFDVSEQLMWLAGEILATEQAAQLHILAHIPLSSDCFQGFARQYNRLIDR